MYKNNQDLYGDGDIPEVDYEPYRNGSQVITPVDPLPESTRERRDGPGGEQSNSPFSHPARQTPAPVQSNKLRTSPFWRMIKWDVRSQDC